MKATDFLFSTMIGVVIITMIFLLWPFEEKRPKPGTYTMNNGIPVMTNFTCNLKLSSPEPNFIYIEGSQNIYISRCEPIVKQITNDKWVIVFKEPKK